MDSSLCQDEEAAELARTMMSKKTKRLYGRMQHGIAKKQYEIGRLEEKRKLVEAEPEKAPSHDSSSKRNPKAAHSKKSKTQHSKEGAVV